MPAARTPRHRRPRSRRAEQERTPKEGCSVQSVPNDTDRTRDNTFEDYGYRDFVAAADDPLSTFALDVDTGSYSIARRWLDEGTLPPRESVRPEEYVNAFDYDYDAPRSGLELTVDGGPSPFDDDNVLVRVGVQGEIVDDRDRGARRAHVRDRHVRVDGPGRSARPRQGVAHDPGRRARRRRHRRDRHLRRRLRHRARTHERVATRDEILDAIDRLRPGGSTNLEAGLRAGVRARRRRVSTRRHQPGGARLRRCRQRRRHRPGRTRRG